MIANNTSMPISSALSWSADGRSKPPSPSPIISPTAMITSEVDTSVTSGG